MESTLPLPHLSSEDGADEESRGDGADEESRGDGADGESRGDGADGESQGDGARPSSRARGGRRGGGQDKGKFFFYSMRMDETNIWFVPCLISSDNFKTLESLTTL